MGVDIVNVKEGDIVVALVVNEAFVQATFTKKHILGHCHRNGTRKERNGGLEELHGFSIDHGQNRVQTGSRTEPCAWELAQDKQFTSPFLFASYRL